MQKIRVAQIGTSKMSHGNDIWQSLLRQSDIFEVVGYAFPEGEREKFPKRARVFDGYREMTVEEILSDPTIEAVAVETEEIYLTKYAQMVADAGKHLHMEKPGGTSLAEFEKLIETLKAKKLAFTTGYMYRFNPAVQYALKQVREGKLGEIFSVEVQMNCTHEKDAREWLSVFPGGMLFFLGCHLIDLIYRIQGEPSEIIPLSTSTGIEGVTSEDFGMVVLKYPNGVSFAKTTDNERGGFKRRQLVITGSLGTIEIRPLEAYMGNLLYSEYSECYSTAWHEERKVVRTQPVDRYDAMMQNFAQIVRGKENPYPYDYEYNLYRLILKCCGGL